MQLTASRPEEVLAFAARPGAVERLDPHSRAVFYTLLARAKREL